MPPTPATVRRLQAGAVAFLGPAQWRGRWVMRCSVTSIATTPAAGRRGRGRRRRRLARGPDGERRLTLTGSGADAAYLETTAARLEGAPR